MARDKEVEYEFYIDAYSPDTIPMLRLGEYLAEFGNLLSNASNVHFRELRKGSTRIMAGVEYEADPKVQKRLLAARQAEDKEVTKIMNRINTMLRDDNAVGRIRSKANGEAVDRLVLPGRDIPRSREIGPFKEFTAVKAMLFRIGGKDQTAHAQLVDSAGRTWNGDLTQEQAAEMAEGLYQWYLVEGKASWIRKEDDEWELKSFRILDFRRLPKESLRGEVDALRSIKGSEWAGIDPADFIDKLRSDDDEVH